MKQKRLEESDTNKLMQKELQKVKNQLESIEDRKDDSPEMK